jgi:hypothetical protein
MQIEGKILQEVKDLTDIKCTVENCIFNSNNKCTAESIEIAKNFVGGTDMELASFDKDSGHSFQTQCLTFRHKK